jgi:CRP-like cAMP-binding protein/uncharacterized membrane protein YdbT with pleckstrin-like domain
MTAPTPETTPEYEIIAQKLATFHIFYDVPFKDLERLNAKVLKPVRRGVTLFRQGDIISRIFLVQSGEIELVRIDAHGRTLRRVVRPGQVLGRLELDATEGQLGTAKTLSQVDLIAVDIASLVRLRTLYPELQSNFDRSDVIGHLRGNPYFAPLSDIEIKWISDIIEVGRADPKATLYQLGEETKHVVIIRQGRVRLLARDKQRWVSAGYVIGYQSILNHTRCQHTAIIENKTIFIRLPKDDYLAITGLHPRHDWSTPPVSVEGLLHRAPIFRDFTKEDIRLLAGFVMQVHYHNPHQTIVQAGKHDYYYHILARGSALQQTVDDNDQIIASVTIGRGTGFGEDSLLFGDPSHETVETLEPTNWIRIHRQDFQLFLEENPESKQRLILSEKLRHRLDKRIYLGDWQREDEEVLSIRRRHWIYLLRRLAKLFLLLFIQFIVAGVVKLVTGNWYVWQNIVIASIYVLPVGGWILLDYLNDFHIVTTRRIVHQEKVIFIKERRTSAPIDKIQELGIDRDMLAKFLRYGDLVIRTAATEGTITFDYHPDPVKAHDIILKEMTRIEKFGLAEQQGSIQKQLQERLHLGLEERIDERALIDSAHVRKIKQPKNLPFIRLLGLQEEPGNRLVWRRHWFGLILTILPALIAVLISAASLVIFSTGSLFSGSAQGFFTVLSILALAGSLFGLWWQWEDWENDRYIVSDQLIEQISKKPLWFDEQHTSLSIERVQNVDFKRPNPFAYLFDFGDVHIQTAAAEGLVTFGFVPAPDEVQFEIFHRIRDYQENMERRRQREQKNDFADWLEAYHKLVTQEQNQHDNH